MNKVKFVTGALLLASSFGALANDVVYNFESVSKIGYIGNTNTQFTGVLVNDTVPSTVSGGSSFDRCDALTREMIKSPGVYNLSITVRETEPAFPGGPWQYSLIACSLELKP